MATFKTWTHPSNGQVRIYVSGVYGQKSNKVWIEACEQDSFGYTYTIKTKIDTDTYVRNADLVNEAEKAIFEAAQARIKTFEEVLALVK